MGLFNRFKNKNKHAEDFKKAYENGDMVKVQMTLADWLDNGKHDALFGLAMTILVGTRKDKSLVEALAIYKTSIEQDKGDSKLFDWYNSTALKLLDDWAGEEVNNNPELKKKFEENQNKDSSNENFENLTCKEFSAKFKEMFDKLADADANESTQIIKKLNELVKVWEKKCPDDAHLACAYVLTHAPEMSQDDLGEYLFKFASGKVYDESLHEWFEDNFVMVLKVHEVMNS